MYTPQRVPHPLLPQLQDEFVEMKAARVVTFVTEPTEWCSGIFIAPKPNRKIRQCVNLTALNMAVTREVHPIATVDRNLAKIPVFGKSHWTILLFTSHACNTLWVLSL